ncbi:MAG: hypothetical protein GY852_09345 [bacterium]|nr:hypothetical protein [bacterium]
MSSGGGDSSATQHDPVYNAGLLEIQQENQEMARVLFDQFTSGGDVSEMEYLQQVVEANAAMLPGRMEHERAGMEFERAGMEDSLTGMRERAPVRTEFFKQALGGVDANAAMDRAEANVTHAFKGAEGQLRRSAMRTGANTGSGAYAALQRRSVIDQAKAEAGARTRAYDNAENESYGRLRDAMSFGV